MTLLPDDGSVIPDGATPDSAIQGSAIPDSAIQNSAIQNSTGLSGSAATRLADDPAVRWITDSTTEVYSGLVERGIEPRRWHDVALVEQILLGRAGRFGEPCRAAAVLARARGQDAPPDPTERDPRPGAAAGQLGLFGDAAESRTPCAPVDLAAAYRDQLGRVTDSAAGDAGAVPVDAGALRLLLAAESGSALVAAQMTRRGMPWDADIHRDILIRHLGPRPPDGQRPDVMAGLADEIAAAFGFPVNPDSPAEMRDAFRRHGIELESTRSQVLAAVEHPAAAPLLHYRDLARLHTANGWHWLDDWATGGRLISEYIPGGVVSGRWATRGGGGLQVPKVLRAAAVADPGHILVVADAAQLEPRVWAAVSRDARLAAAAQQSDLYAAIAADGFGGDRRHAKLAMLGAMYGQTTGEAARLMATLRRRYPVAVDFVESAARRGETGKVVTSVLGRACPPPSPDWWATVGASSGPDTERASRHASRDRGRFTRNFVIQASAADWAAVWLTTLRLALLDVPGAEMVLFQHDEVVVHVPEHRAHAVAAATTQAANRARDLVFPGSDVPTPVRPEIVRCYADAK